ncbi:MAG: hypothetical protein JNM66_17395 [Bryobacterales bacterium]|nr:hypothetical protein [Bryobacterales bacterium]
MIAEEDEVFLGAEADHGRMHAFSGLVAPSPVEVAGEGLEDLLDDGLLNDAPHCQCVEASAWSVQTIRLVTVVLFYGSVLIRSESSKEYDLVAGWRGRIREMGQMDGKFPDHENAIGARGRDWELGFQVHGGASRRGSTEPLTRRRGRHFVTTNVSKK